MLFLSLCVCWLLSPIWAATFDRQPTSSSQQAAAVSALISHSLCARIVCFRPISLIRFACCAAGFLVASAILLLVLVLPTSYSLLSFCFFFVRSKRMQMEPTSRVSGVSAMSKCDSLSSCYYDCCLCCRFGARAMNSFPPPASVGLCLCLRARITRQTLQTHTQKQRDKSSKVSCWSTRLDSSELCQCS